MKKRITIGLVGLGTVGTGLVKALHTQRKRVQERYGLDLHLALVAEKNWRRKRKVTIPPEKRVRDAQQIIDDPSIDIVVELIGGCGDAKVVVEKAINAGKHVVTANKALLAAHGRQIFKRAGERGVDLYYEASVCGGIPLIKTLREGLASNRVRSIAGIVNGTCNYILTSMSDSGTDFLPALRNAQRLGYAEADPTLDINGMDSAHKLTVLSTLASGRSIALKDIYVEGITGISVQDILYARKFGYTIKLLAIYKQEDGRIEARVHPTLVPCNLLLASVGGAYNAVYVKADPVGEIVLYGAGAGEKPTASAVLSDIIDIGLNSVYGSHGRVPVIAAQAGKTSLRKIDEVETQYYLRFSVIDRPGVLAGITGILGKLQISLTSVIQTERKAGGVVPVVMMTHRARERNVRQALTAIDRLSYIKARTMLIRVEDSK